MALYHLDSAQLEPPPEPERTPAEWMEACTHCAACERVWREFVDAQDYFGWMDEMARRLGCDDCGEWSE